MLLLVQTDEDQIFRLTSFQHWIFKYDRGELRKNRAAVKSDLIEKMRNKWCDSTREKPNFTSLKQQTKQKKMQTRATGAGVMIRVTGEAGLVHRYTSSNVLDERTQRATIYSNR